MNQLLHEFLYHLSFSELKITLLGLGDDIQILIAGGEKPHIGSVVTAIPRMSLTGDGSRSATSSVYNLTGHKDEAICRKIAETAAVITGHTAVCTGGFHMDQATPEQLKEIMAVMQTAEEDLRQFLEQLSCRENS